MELFKNVEESVISVWRPVAVGRRKAVNFGVTLLQSHGGDVPFEVVHAVRVHEVQSSAFRPLYVNAVTPWGVVLLISFEALLN